MILIARIIASLNANRRAGEVGAAVACGALLALIPSANLLWLLLFVITFFLKINHAMELVSLALLSPLAPLFDPLLHTLGLAVLTAEPLQELFTGLYNVPLLPFTRFNNTVVLGGLIGGLIMWAPIYFLVRALVRVYRKSIHPKLADSKIVRTFTRIPIVSKLITLTRKFQRIYAVIQ